MLRRVVIGVGFAALVATTVLGGGFRNRRAAVLSGLDRVRDLLGIVKLDQL